jgi:hypothetical protein
VIPNSGTRLGSTDLRMGIDATVATRRAPTGKAAVENFMVGCVREERGWMFASSEGKS